MEWIERRGKVIFVRRHVYDVLSSYYVYAQSFEPNANVPIAQFIRQNYCGRENRVAYWREVVEYWSSMPNVLTIDYDKIVKDTKLAIRQIGEFVQEEPLYDYPLLPKKVESIWKFRWNRLASIRPESTSILGNRSGATINWRTEFTEDDKVFIAGNAGDTLKKFYR